MSHSKSFHYGALNIEHIPLFEDEYLLINDAAEIIKKNIRKIAGKYQEKIMTS